MKTKLYLDLKEFIKKITRPESQWKKEMLGEGDSEVEQFPKLVYILASNYQIAKAIYRRLYPEGRIIDLRYIHGNEVVMGVRDIEVIISNDRYPNYTFYYRLEYLRQRESLGRVKLVYEQDIQEKQVGEEISG